MTNETLEQQAEHAASEIHITLLASKPTLVCGMCGGTMFVSITTPEETECSHCRGTGTVAGEVFEKDLTVCILRELQRVRANALEELREPISVAIANLKTITQDGVANIADVVRVREYLDRALTTTERNIKE